VFDEQAFRQVLLGEPAIEAFRGIFGDTAGVELEHWVKMAKWIYTNGL
jgi:hypothetical protein